MNTSLTIVLKNAMEDAIGDETLLRSPWRTLLITLARPLLRILLRTQLRILLTKF